MTYRWKKAMAMNSQQARDILLRYRPGSSDDTDPEVKEALAFAEQNAELATWLKTHHEFQNRTKATYRSLPVPEGLREQIVSERKVQRGVFTTTARVALASLVTVLILVGASIVMKQSAAPDDQFANFRSRMVKSPK